MESKKVKLKEVESSIVTRGKWQGYVGREKGDIAERLQNSS